MAELSEPYNTLPNGGIHMDIKHLPKVIKNFIIASNKPNQDDFVDSFADNAIVVDEGKEHRGKLAIKKWSNNHFDVNVTLDPRTVNQVGDEIIVTCKLSGDYDKTGLPDPLLLDFHFQINEGKIINLSII
jgi:hypothetical protein